MSDKLNTVSFTEREVEALIEALEPLVRVYRDINFESTNPLQFEQETRISSGKWHKVKQALNLLKSKRSFGR